MRDQRDSLFLSEVMRTGKAKYVTGKAKYVTNKQRQFGYLVAMTVTSWDGPEQIPVNTGLYRCGDCPTITNKLQH